MDTYCTNQTLIELLAKVQQLRLEQEIKNWESLLKYIIAFAGRLLL